MRGVVCAAMLVVCPVLLQADWTVIDDDTAGFTSANLTAYSGLSGFGAYNGTIRHSGPTADTNTWAQWTFTGLANGDYDVAVCHARYTPVNANWVGRNRFRIVGALDGYGFFTSVKYPYYTNQVVLVDGTAVARPFVLLNNGPVRVTGGTLTVRLEWHVATDSVVADAVAIRPRDATRTVFHSDDLAGITTIAMPGFAEDANAAAGTKVYSSSVNEATNQYVRWTFAGMQPGRYRLWTTWTGAANLSPSVPYALYAGSDAAPFATQLINQEQAPVGTQDWSVAWQPLTNGAAAGLYTLTGSVFHVEVRGVANASGVDYVVGDAVRAEFAGPLDAPPSATLVELQ